MNHVAFVSSAYGIAFFVLAGIALWLAVDHRARKRELADLEALTAWRAAGARGTLVLDCQISSTVVAPYQREVQRANGL